MDTPLLLDIRTVARRLGVGRSTVYELIRSGDLGSVKIGARRLVTEAQLAAFVAKLEDEAQLAAFVAKLEDEAQR